MLIRPIHPYIRSGCRSGFSLTELLIVISVIVLILAMAVPVYDAMSNDRSISASENVIAAMLQRARAKAIGLQEKRGVLFFEDPITKRYAMTIVKLVDDPTGNVVYPYVEIE